MNFDTEQEEFQNKAFEIFQTSEYKFKFIKHELTQMHRGLKPLYQDSLLNIQGNNWVLIVHTDGQILVYGEGWTDEQLTEISLAFDFSRHSDITVSGDSQIITRLSDLNIFSNFTITRVRPFYRSSEINRFEDPNLSIELAQEDEIEELAGMLQQYYHEEYNGENDKTIEEMEERVFTCVANETLYVLKNNAQLILSFCTIIDPDVGILFTKPDQRGNGYGKILLSHCAQLLLDENEEVYLMTIKSVTDSNIVATKVGFETFFECSFVVINNNV